MLIGEIATQPPELAGSDAKAVRPVAYLRRVPPPPLGAAPPWLPVPVSTAAQSLGVSLRTLRRWRSRGIGPGAIPPGRYRGNQHWYCPAELLAFYETVTRPADARSAEALIAAWAEANESALGTLMRSPQPPARRMGWSARATRNRRYQRRRKAREKEKQ